MRETDVETALLPAGLAAPGRSAEIPESADAYGWLVGSWDLDVRNYWGDVSGLGLTGEAHFGWVLEGRAIQDVWIMPRREERSGPIEKTRNMYGTTLRVWDPAIQGWRIRFARHEKTRFTCRAFRSPPMSRQPINCARRWTVRRSCWWWFHRTSCEELSATCSRC